MKAEVNERGPSPPPGKGIDLRAGLPVTADLAALGGEGKPPEVGIDAVADESDKQYEAVKQLQEDSERMTDLINGPLQSRPNDPALHHEIGAIALRSGLVPEAIRWFESALQVSPDHLPTHRTLAGLYQQLDNPVLAARHRAIAQRLASAQPKP